jgi:hypothetical protein
MVLMPILREVSSPLLTLDSKEYIKIMCRIFNANPTKVKTCVRECETLLLNRALYTSTGENDPSILHWRDTAVGVIKRAVALINENRVVKLRCREMLLDVYSTCYASAVDLDPEHLAMAIGYAAWSLYKSKDDPPCRVLFDNQNMSLSKLMDINELSDNLTSRLISRGWKTRTPYRDFYSPVTNAAPS